MAARGQDIYANIAATRVVESAANTLTFSELSTGIGLGMGVGLIIDKLEWEPKVAGIAVANFAGDADQIEVALCSQNSIADLTGFNDRRILVKDSMYLRVAAAAVTQHIIQLPFMKQYNPPIIIAAPRLFFAVKGTGMGAAVTIDFRLYFRYINLDVQTYLELAEAFVLTG